MGTTPPSVTLTRTIAASARDLYAAWTDPQLLKRWMAPAPYEGTVETDVRVGGRYRIALAGPEGEMHVTTGEYRELVPGERLVKTWKYEGTHPDADPSESVLTVLFRETAPGITELTIQHDQVSTAEGRETLRIGWTEALSDLEKLFVR